MLHGYAIRVRRYGYDDTAIRECGLWEVSVHRGPSPLPWPVSTPLPFGLVSGRPPPWLDPTVPRPNPAPPSSGSPPPPSGSPSALRPGCRRWAGPRHGRIRHHQGQIQRPRRRRDRILRSRSQLWCPTVRLPSATAGLPSPFGLDASLDITAAARPSLAAAAGSASLAASPSLAAPAEPPSLAAATSLDAAATARPSLDAAATRPSLATATRSPSLAAAVGHPSLAAGAALPCRLLAARAPSSLATDFMSWP
ncbi:hypothetical protein GUJ93_ZPchr0009g1929 [Zizania palustris]|uniref:Uncharacterized protein n=1 Tax=Zizania palustris TaxID=103762 RepID=A0A8J5RY93_ZIZPA|nr:hypothetical protein GUJ93_ZPchr0009g1929 [Zizania palustris]